MPDQFSELKELLEPLANQTRMGSAIGTGMASSAIVARTGAQQHFIDAKTPKGDPWPALTWPRLEGGTDPLRNTGRLMASLDTVIEGDTIVLFTNRIGAGLQNYGGVIVPKRAKFLTIPATLEAKRAGGARLFPQQLFPRINKAKTGGVLIDGEGIVQYYLTKKTTITAREFLGFSDETQTEILGILMDHILEDWLDPSQQAAAAAGQAAAA